MKTDSELQRDVMTELKWEPTIHAAEIGVAVKDGVVTLSGDVATYSIKWAWIGLAAKIMLRINIPSMNNAVNFRSMF